jgi:DNA-directed RNA polymerase subunit beta'
LRNASLVKRKDNTIVVMNRHGELVVMDDTGREREHHRLVYGAVMKVVDGARVTSGQIVAEWDPFAAPILTEVGGIVQYGDLVEGVTVMEKVDEPISARASASSTQRRAKR